MSLHLRDTQAPDQSNDILGRFIKASVRFLASLLVEQSFISLAQAYDRELEFVKNNVSSRPFVEFRARGPQLKDKPLEPASIGHAYIVQGRELDNGLSVYNGAAGFYPDPNAPSKPTAFKEMASSVPGKVMATFPDAKSEVTFKVYISPLQENDVAQVIKKWSPPTEPEKGEPKSYNLFTQNCVSFTADVAKALGLDVPRGPKNIAAEYPTNFVNLLKARNDKYTPLRFTPNGRTPGQSSQPPQGGQPINRGQEAGQQTREGQPKPNPTPPSSPPSQTQPGEPELPSMPPHQGGGGGASTPQQPPVENPPPH